MALSITHTFVSAKGDGTDLTLLQPSNWNDQHVITLDGGMLLGNSAATNGPVQQIPIATFTSNMFTTGDVKLTLKQTPDTGWIMVKGLNTGSIGNAASGATQRANTDTLALFTLFYNINGSADTVAPITLAGAATTRAAQGSATTAFANGVCMTMPSGSSSLSLGTANIMAKL